MEADGRAGLRLPAAHRFLAPKPGIAAIRRPIGLEGSQRDTVPLCHRLCTGCGNEVYDVFVPSKSLPAVSGTRKRRGHAAGTWGGLGSKPSGAFASCMLSKMVIASHTSVNPSKPVAHRKHKRVQPATAR